MTMRVLDLFSGIGGFSLGLERAGMRTVAFCERDEFCRDVLAKHWPSVPCFEDIHDLDADRLGGIGSIDLVCGGFPCQPFSQAGKQLAQADDRHLWPAMREVIALSRPAWVIGENVTGIVALALDDVLADLEGLGYASRALIIPACAVDARHRRNRVWIIARDTNRQGESVGAEHEEVAELCGTVADADCDELRIEPRRGRWPRGEGPLQSLSNGPEGAAAHADGSGLEGRDSPVMSERGAEWLAGSRRAPAADTPSLQRAAFIGNESDRADDSARCTWQPESGVGRVADGIPRRVDRLRTLGNAVVPQVVYELGRAIMSIG